MFDDCNFTAEIMVFVTCNLLCPANCEQPHPLHKADDQTPDDNIFLCTYVSYKPQLTKAVPLLVNNMSKNFQSQL